MVVALAVPQPFSHSCANVPTHFECGWAEGLAGNWSQATGEQNLGRLYNRCSANDFDPSKSHEMDGPLEVVHNRASHRP